MHILTGVLEVIYLISCAFLVIVVLLQTGKGGGLAGAFGGGGGMDSAFGAKVGGPLRKITAVFAGGFLVLALALTMLIGPKGSVVDTTGNTPAATQQDNSSVAPDQTQPDAQQSDEAQTPAPEAQQNAPADEGQAQAPANDKAPAADAAPAQQNAAPNAE